MFRVCFPIALAAVALSACVPTAPQSAMAGPGFDSVSDGVAVGLFRAVCADNAGDLSNATQILAGLPVVYNPVDDLYYHAQYDLSFRVTLSGGNGWCAMAWDPVGSQSAAANAMRASVPSAIVRGENDGNDLILAGLNGRP